MREFVALVDALDQSTSMNTKLEALVAYFSHAEPGDAAWVVALLTGRRPRRLVRHADLRCFAALASGLPDWMIEESYAHTGDLAETLALLVPGEASADELPLRWWIEELLVPLRGKLPEDQQQIIIDAWSRLGGIERFLFNKLLTGGFRVGVSDGLVVKALARASGLGAEVITRRIMGEWTPSAAWYSALLHLDTTQDAWSAPYPFFLAHALTQPLNTLGAVSTWTFEWKWDGIRVQVVKRAGHVMLWSRGEEMLSGRFPEIEQDALALPDGTVVDGELLAWDRERPRPFADLQRRIQRKNPSAVMQQSVPVALMLYDCLEYHGSDCRERPLHERRAMLETLVARHAGSRLRLSPLLAVSDWDELFAQHRTAREQQAEGIMLKRRDSAYGVGRRTGDWWKWKTDPMHVDAVLVYAQAGHGRRAGLFTDYTLAVWDGDALVPFAKAYSGLSDTEIREVDRFVKAHTRERFGPVRTVEPSLVFEVAFEGIQRSSRHKSGVAVRFPRIARWRRDKSARDADTIETVRALIYAHS